MGQPESAAVQRIWAPSPPPSSRRAIFRNCWIPRIPAIPVPAPRSERTPLGRPIVFGPIYDPSTTRRVGDAHRPGSVPRQHHSAESRWDPVATNVIQKIGIQDPTFAVAVAQHSDHQRSARFSPADLGHQDRSPGERKNQLSGYYNHSYRSRYNNGAGRFPAVSGSGLQFLAAADHSRPPGAAVADVHGLAATLSTAQPPASTGS